MRALGVLLLAAAPFLFAQEGEEAAALAREAWAREAREGMIREILRYKKPRVTDRRVLAAMRKVERHRFVPASVARMAYEDRPLSIGWGQTISQPYIVAAMTELLGVRRGDRILEVGTGSGYQAAILAELGAEVYSIEIVEALARRAEKTLDELGYERVRVKAGDGYKGWPRAAPFDGIIVTCAPDHIPKPLLEQLRTGGRLVIPVGAKSGKNDWAVQELTVVRKTKKGIEREKTMDVRFVPMTGEAEHKTLGGDKKYLNPFGDK